MSMKPFRGIQLNKAHPLAKRLVGCWIFNELTGSTAFDLSGNRLNCTFDSTNPPDRIADYLYFKGGIVAYASISHADTSGLFDFGTGDFTLFVEFRTTSSNNQYIFGKNYSAADGVKWWSLAIVGGEINGHLDNGSTLTTLTSITSTYDDGKWHTAVLRRKGGDCKLFADGVDVTNGTFIVGDDLNNTGIVILGGRADLSSVREFADDIRHVSFYDIAVSDIDIKQLYYNPYVMFEYPVNPSISYYVAAGGDETVYLDLKVIIKSTATNLLDLKSQIKSTATNLLDNKVSILVTDTGELDLKATIKDIETRQIDGKVRIKDTTTNLLDLKTNIQNVDTNLLDNKVAIKDTTTKLLDLKATIKDTITNLLDLKTTIGNVAANLLDCKVMVQDDATNLLDMKVAILDNTIDLLDLKTQIKNTVSNLLDCEVRIVDVDTNLLDGKVSIKNTATNLLDGKVVIMTTAPTDKLDLKVNVYVDSRRRLIFF